METFLSHLCINDPNIAPNDAVAFYVETMFQNEPNPNGFDYRHLVAVLHFRCRHVDVLTCARDLCTGIQWETEEMHSKHNN